MKVNIKVEGINKAKIFIDDKEIERVAKINFNTAVDEAPTVTLEFIPSELNIEMDNFLFLKEKSIDEYSVEELMGIVAKKCICKAIKNSLEE